MAICTSAKIHSVAFHDTAGAAREVAERREPGTAAIASRAAADRYGLLVLDEAIQDDSENRTRFLVIERGDPIRPESAALVLPTPHPSPPPQGGRGLGHKCSVAFVTAHRPGSLALALDCFARRSVNLTRLDSRPMRGRPFEYRFYLDFAIDQLAGAEAALRALEDATAEVRLFGTYPAA